MAAMTTSHFRSTYTGHTLKWTEITAKVGIAGATDLKKGGAIEKTETGWIVR